MIDYTKLQPKKKDRLTEIAYKEIKNAIMECKLKPGECISGTQLAKLLKMSRTPIREAINSLALEGYVEIQNGVGIFVKSITIREIMELYEVRAVLEVAILEHAIHKIPALSLEALKDKWLYYQTQLLAGVAVSYADISELDYETHSLINQHCSNSYLKDLVNNIYLQVQRIQYLSAKALGDVRQTIDQHLELISFIEQRDFEKGSQALKVHIQNAVHYIVLQPSEMEL